MSEKKNSVLLEAIESGSAGEVLALAESLREQLLGMPSDGGTDALMGEVNRSISWLSRPDMKLGGVMPAHAQARKSVGAVAAACGFKGSAGEL